ADVVWLCNPNNPTADLIPLDGLERLASSASCPLVVDEAYFEFSGVTAAGLIARYPHLIVVRTLSKAFSLAGLRVGYALAARAAIESLLRAGIVVRDVSSKPGLANCLRPTVRLPGENARFVAALTATT